MKYQYEMYKAEDDEHLKQLLNSSTKNWQVYDVIYCGSHYMVIFRRPALG